MSEWKPIETATLEAGKTVILGRTGEWSKPGAWFAGYQGIPSGWAEDEIYAAKEEFLEPTHWMPLPNPPQP